MTIVAQRLAEQFDKNSPRCNQVDTIKRRHVRRYMYGVTAKLLFATRRRAGLSHCCVQRVGRQKGTMPGKGVRDVSADAFIKAYAAHLKSNDNVRAVLLSVRDFAPRDTRCLHRCNVAPDGVAARADQATTVGGHCQDRCIQGVGTI